LGILGVVCDAQAFHLNAHFIVVKLGVVLNVELIQSYREDWVGVVDRVNTNQIHFCEGQLNLHQSLAIASAVLEILRGIITFAVLSELLELLKRIIFERRPRYHRQSSLDSRGQLLLHFVEKAGFLFFLPLWTIVRIHLIKVAFSELQTVDCLPLNNFFKLHKLHESDPA
jgi:hypothetical protein